jgi:hypothetical protein
LSLDELNDEYEEYLEEVGKLYLNKANIPLHWENEDDY